MDKQEDKESAHSFDSSIDLNSILDTESTVSMCKQEVARLDRHLQTSDQLSFINCTPEKEFKNFQGDFGQGGMFIGFKKGMGGQEIQINESKIKQAKMFFDDDQLEEKDYFSMPQPPQRKQKRLLFSPEGSNEKEQYTMPCFKTVGTGLEVKVSKDIQSKAKMLLNEFSSYRKPTKLKKDANVIDESFVKTVNNQKDPSSKNMFQVPDSKLLKVGLKGKTETGELERKSFNWEQYEKQYLQEIAREQSSEKNRINTSKKAKRISTNVRQASLQFKRMKLYHLELSVEAEKEASKNLARRLEQPELFQHIKEDCHIFKCVLCSIKYNNDNIGIKQLYSIMNKQFAKKWISQDDFIPIYHQVYFKLLKYECFWPQIANKLCNPSNLIVEISKKMLKLATQGICSYLKKCLEKEQIGRKINLVVREKYVNKKMKIIFLLLSDGWYSVWAAIEPQNILYPYLVDSQKIRIGTKLCLCLWIKHPFSNILDFCKSKISTNSCIQFFYNGSMILKPNAKLGYTRQQFYRPLNKCRQRGGLIPVVEGFVIRIFTVKEKNKKISGFSHHYAQILTPEGFTQLIQFVLGEQNSLVQFFRLFRCYNFYKLKIVESGMLNFGMDSSKFEEIKRCKISQKDKVYPEAVLKLLQSRLLNRKILQKIKESTIYDVICENGKLSTGNYPAIEIQIQGQTVQLMKEVVFQQVSLVQTSDNKLKFRKNRYSSQCKRVHPIYKLIV